MSSLYVGIWLLVFVGIFWGYCGITEVLDKQNGKTPKRDRIFAGVIIFAGYAILMLFLFHGFFKKSNWDEIKIIAILVSLLVAVFEAERHIKKSKSEKKKKVFRGLRWFAAIYSVCMVIAVWLDLETALNALDKLNDIWGIGLTFCSAWIIYVVQKDTDE